MKLFILDDAIADLAEIKENVKKNRTGASYKKFVLDIAQLLKDIQAYPRAGSVPPEAGDLGLEIRARLVEQFRVIYEIREDAIWVRMFISTQRDYMSHLMARMLR